MADYILTAQAIADLKAMYNKTQQLYDETQRLLRSTMGQEKGLNYYSATQVRNATANNVPVGGVLEISTTQPITLTASDMRRGAPFLRGIAPQTAELGKTKYGIALGPIQAGEIGPVAMQGIVQANIYVEDADHEFASPTNNQTSFVTSASSGLFRILEKDAGTGLVKGTLFLQWPAAETGTILAYRGSRVRKNGTSTTDFDSFDHDSDIGAAQYLQFDQKIGDEAAVGIEHDPTETTPATNGNFAVTKGGVYKVNISAGWSYHPTGSWTTDNVASPRVECEYKRSGSWTSFGRMDAAFYWDTDWTTFLTTGDGNYENRCISLVVALQADEILRFRVFWNATDASGPEIYFVAYMNWQRFQAYEAWTDIFP